MEELRSACEAGNLKDIKDFLEKSVLDVNEKHRFTRETALHYAVKSGNPEAVSCIIEEGADVSLRDKDGRTAFYVAALNGNLEIIRLLKGCGAEHDVPNNWGWTALVAAVVSGHTDSVCYLLDEVQASTEIRDTTGWTPLHWAAAQGHTDIIDKLIKSGANLEAGDSVGARPLLRAAEFGHVAAIRLLLQRGAKRDSRTEHGSTAAHLAARMGQRDVLSELLKDRTQAVCDSSSDGSKPLHEAAARGHTDCCAELLDAGGDIEAIDNDGRTALHRAASTGDTFVVELLLKRAANVDAVDSAGWTALHYAAANNQPVISALLLNNKANVHASDHTGNTPLHVAAKAGACPSAVVLISKGADLAERNKNGQSALCVSETAEIARILRQSGAKLDDLTKADIQLLLHKKLLREDDEEVVQILGRGFKPETLQYNPEDSKFLETLIAHTKGGSIERVFVTVYDWSRDLLKLHASLGKQQLVSDMSLKQWMFDYHGFQLDEFKVSVKAPSFDFINVSKDAIELRLYVPAVPWSDALGVTTSTESCRLQQRVVSEFHRCFRVPKDYLGSFEVHLSAGPSGGVNATCRLGLLEQILLACGMGISSPLCEDSSWGLTKLGVVGLGASVGAAIGLRSSGWQVPVASALGGLLIGLIATRLLQTGGEFLFYWRFHNEKLTLSAEKTSAPPLP